MFGNLIVNTGRIEASDKGITLDSDEGAFYANTIENSGLIVSAFESDDFVAIRMAGEYRDEGSNPYGSSNELTLRAPAYVAGEFWLERRTETDVSLVSGPSHSVRWVFEDSLVDCDVDCYYDDNGARSFTTSGPVPWFRNPAGGTTLDDADDEFATIDPSAFAAAAHQLADLSGMASIMANDALSPFAPKRNGFWAAARGSRMEYDGDGRATLDQDTHTSGFAGGYVRDIGNGAAGITLGYGKSDLEVGSAWKDYYSHSYDNKAKGYFAGLHGVASLGPVRIGVGVSGGRMEHDDKRFINDNLERDGQSYATADYDSRWYAPELSLSVPVSVGAKTTITPKIHGRYMVQKIDGYSERGSNADATVAKRTIKVDEISAGIDFTRQFDNSSLTARVGYVKRNLRGSDQVRVSMIGDTNDVAYFGQNVKAAYVGLGYNLAIKERVALEITGSYLSGSDVKGGSVGASLKIKF